MIIKKYSPYLFVICAFSLFGFWAKTVTRINPPPMVRSIASTNDCQSLVKTILNDESASAAILDNVFATKFKINIWNSILTPREFDNFSNHEYFKWLEIYKDPAKELARLNPVTIEQKLALIEVINSKYTTDVIGSKNNFTTEIENLGALRLRKLAKHLKSFDPSSKITREDLNDFAADLMIILKGPPVSLMDYFTKDKTLKAKLRLAHTVQEDMLLMGLKGVINRIPERNSYTRYERAKYITQRFFQHKIWKYMVLPYDLPIIERVQIPYELLEKIILEGLDAHEQELVAILKKQNMIDHYERFRKIYKPIAFSIGFYVYYKKYDGKMDENQEEERKKLITEFTELGSQILEVTETTDKSPEEIKEENFQRILKRFENENGRKPTPSEYDEIRNSIF